MKSSSHNLLLNRTFQYLGIILIMAAMGGGYWYWKQAQAGVAQKAANNQGLVGYWSFDEGTGTQAGDASGSGNTGTLTNGPTWVDGKLGKAVNFDGVNDYAVTPSSAALDMSSKSFAVSAWFRTSTTQTDKILVEHSIWTSDSGVYQLTASGPNSLRFSWPSYWTQYSTTPDITGVNYADNKWHHLVGVFDNGSKQATTYLDGVLKTTQSGITSGPLSGTSPLYIGNRGAGTGNFFTGSIDEVRIYNRALEETEIKNLYNLGAAKLQKTQVADLTSGLVGYWPFNGKDVSGTTAYDRSTSGNNGTLTNGPTKTEGKVGQALSFNGTNQYVNMGNVLNIGSGDVTLSAWIKPPNTSQSCGTFIGKRQGTSPYPQYQFVIGTLLSDGNCTASKKLGTVFYNGVAPFSSNAQVYVTVNDIADGNWHHATVTRVGSTIKIYVDGLDMPITTVVSGAVANTTNAGDFEVGFSNGPVYYGGFIDEPRIYSRALSASEIWDLYQMGNPDKMNSADSQGDSLEKGMVGYWKLDDASGTSAADSSGNANTGTLTNGPTWTTGRIGGATNFDGTDDYIEVPSNTRYDSSVGTWSFWAKADTLPTTSGDSVLFRANSSSSYNGANVYINTSGRFGFQIKDASAQVSGNSDLTTMANDGSWHHVVLSWTMANGGMNRFYVDGKETATGVNTAAWNFSSQPFRFADASDAYWEIFDGSFDEVRIYNRTLTADEVAKLYKTTAPDNPDTGLVGYWSFNGKDLSGTTAYDRSGKGNNSTLTNGPTVTEGKSGQALNFDGSNDYVTAGSATNLDDIATKTVMAWIKPSAFGVDRYVLAKGDSVGGTGWYLFLTTDGRLEYVKRASGTNGIWYTAAGSIALNQWQSIAVTYDRSSASNDPKFYINGAIATSSEVSGPPGAMITDAADSLIIGRNTSAVTPFSGVIDEVLVYNRILSASEVFAQYAAGESAKKTCGTVADADGNLYGTVVIGNQCWMRQNMRVGTRIAASTSQTNNATIEKYCYADSDANCTSANPNQPDGGLYQWDEAMQYSTTAGARGICPAGWHIPTDAEQHTLENYLKDAGQTCNASRSGTFDCSTAGTKLKPGGTSGFEGNLAGYAYAGSFYSRGTFGFFRSSSESGATAWLRYVPSSGAAVGRDAVDKTVGISVRCLHD